MERTDWFDGETKPEHIGVYERDYGAGPWVQPADIGCSYWDGERWYWRADTPEIAALQPHVTFRQELPWRGLTRPA